MTPSEFLQRFSSREISEYIALRRIERREDEQARKEAEHKAKTGTKGGKTQDIELGS